MIFNEKRKNERKNEITHKKQQQVTTYVFDGNL